MNPDPVMLKTDHKTPNIKRLFPAEKEIPAVLLMNNHTNNNHLYSMPC